MPHGILWKYESADGVRVLSGHPGAFSDTVEEAKAEGRKILVGVKGVPVMPLSVVEIKQTLGDEIVQNCEELELGPDEELFYDVTGLPNWRSQPWWPVA